MQRLTFGIDFDGTIVTHDFPEIGTLYEESIRIMKLIKERGHDIILFTCRENYSRAWLDEAVEFLRSHGVEVDSVNENTPYWKSQGYTSRKPFWDLLIDDSAGFNPEHWWKLEDTIYAMEGKGSVMAKYDGNG
jgi:hypothetical protein